jgi:hypothetical protein
MTILWMIVNQATINNKPPVIHWKELQLQGISCILGFFSGLGQNA